MAPSRRPPTMTWRKTIRPHSRQATAHHLPSPLRGRVREGDYWKIPRSPLPICFADRPPPQGGGEKQNSMPPAAHWPLQLAGRGLFRPDQLITTAVQLNQICRRQDILPGLVELDALIAHHELPRLEIGLDKRVADFLGIG